MSIVRQFVCTVHYRAAIVGDADAMRSAVWATLLHCMSTDADPHHTRCPSGEESWCFYQRALASGEEPESHEERIKHPLAYEVAKAMLPVYQQMSNPNLLKRLAKGKTQNKWVSPLSYLSPKTIFVSRHKLQGAAASAVGVLNGGASQLTEIMKEMAIEVNEVTYAYAEEKDQLRMQGASARMTASFKIGRKDKQSEKKLERAQQVTEEGTTYAPGGFFVTKEEAV